MIRAIAAGAVPALAVVLVALWVLAPPRPLAARFAAEDCRRVALVDAATGRALRGAEDMALAPGGDALIVSARDRLDPSQPEGGLYAVRLSSLGVDGPADARPLHGARGAAGPFRPHGVALSPDGARLAVVNRMAADAGAVEIGPLSPEGWRPDRMIRDSRLCRANDLAFDEAGPGAPETLRVTIDRADCGRSISDLIGGTGAIARIDAAGLAIETAGLNHPNGLAAGWIAETRAARLIGPADPLPLPGGPDNLSLFDGRIVAALHPNLVRTGLYLAGWLPRVSSRIVAVDPATGAVEPLYDDTAGALFSGATVGVLAGGRLVAGSVGDFGLLLCERRE